MSASDFREDLRDMEIIAPKYHKIDLLNLWGTPFSIVIPLQDLSKNLKQQSNIALEIVKEKIKSRSELPCVIYVVLAETLALRIEPGTSDRLQTHLNNKSGWPQFTLIDKNCPEYQEQIKNIFDSPNVDPEPFRVHLLIRIGEDPPTPSCSNAN